MSETRVILVSMVKNESKIIERMMKTCLADVDGVFIYDTGSTDNTVQLCRDFFEKEKVIGEVFEGSWVNFGVSRSASLEKARDWVISKGWDGAKTWGLFLDADMKFVGPIQKQKLEELPATTYGVCLNQKNSSIIYSNMRLIRLNQNWKCVGATHEYWDVGSKVTWEAPWIDDIGDGGAKADKFTRDARLLEEELEKNPTHDRTLFYLGQTYQCLQQLEKSNEILQRRIDVGGWNEEVYMATVYRGDNFMSLKEEAKAIKEWLDAWQLCQDRTEAAIKLIRHYRLKPRSQFIGWMLLEKLFEQQYGHKIDREGKMDPLKKNGYVLFVNHNNMGHDFWEELGILASWVGKKKEARWRLDERMLSHELDWGRRNHILGYYKWYEEKIKPVKFRRLDYPLDSVPWAEEDDSGIWRCYNPSIRSRTDGTYDLNLRYANYSTVDAKNFPYRGRHGTIQTRNLLCRLRDDYTFTEEREELIIPEKYLLRKNNHIVGVEDLRWIQGSDKREFFATGRQTSTYDSNQIVYITWDKGEGEGECVEPTVTPLPAPGNHAQGQCQKNWLPFMHDGKLKFIYHINPFEVWDLSGNKYVGLQTKNANLDGFRGSAAPVSWKSEERPEEAYIMVIHNSHYSDAGRRYYHRFMTLDKDLKPCRVSLLCRWTDDAIEYVSGICPTINGKGYAVVFGTKDSEAYLAEMNKEQIEKMLWFTA